MGSGPFCRRWIPSLSNDVAPLPEPGLSLFVVLFQLFAVEPAFEVLVDCVAAAGAGGELGWEPCTNRPDLHPKASASVTIADRVLGHAGRIHPDAAREAAVPAETTLFELDRGALLDRASGRVTARPLARFPAVVRDLSLIVGEDTLAGQVYAAVMEFGEELVEGVLCFDEYSGEGVEEGSKALAFSITYHNQRVKTHTASSCSSFRNTIDTHNIFFL